MPSPAPSAQPTGSAAPASGDLALSAMAVSPKPQIFSRAQWGADEKLREQSAPSYGTIKTGFVHHTVNANDYSRDDVPKLLRSIYAYHVEARGWRDIGYNFLVDRFGRIWEGRWGGVNKAVVGAHTLGYNEVGFAMSAIGNFEEVQPPSGRARRLRGAVRLEALQVRHQGRRQQAVGEGPLPAGDQRPP